MEAESLPAQADVKRNGERQNGEMRIHRKQKGRKGILALLSMYSKEINKTPLLTTEEEKELANRIAEGDWEARDHMARANLRLVIKLARRRLGSGLSFQDLIQEGNLGLLRGIEGFDPERGTRVSTYATHWIKESIGRAIGNQAFFVRIPEYMIEWIKHWRKATNKLAEKLGRSPTEAEIAEYLHHTKNLRLSEKQIKELQEAMHLRDNPPPTGSGPEGPRFGRMNLYSTETEPDAVAEMVDDLRSAMDALEHMDAEHAAVLRLRYGLGGGKPQTLKEIGKIMGKSRYLIGRMEEKALESVRKQLHVEMS